MNGIHDFFAKLGPQLLISELGIPQIHKQLMLRGACHLTGFECDIDQILSDGSG